MGRVKVMFARSVLVVFVLFASAVLAYAVIQVVIAAPWVLAAFAFIVLITWALFNAKW